MESTSDRAPVAPLRRASDGRLVAGVARGIAEHLAVEVAWVRVGFVALTLFGGAGIVAYGALWLFVPLDSGALDSETPLTGRPVPVPEGAATSAGTRGSRRVRGGHPGSSPSREQTTTLLVSGGAVLLGALLLVSAAGFGVGWLAPLVLVALGVALLWLQADEEHRDRLRAGVGRVAPTGRTGLVQAVSGGLLVVTGLVVFVIGGYGVAEAGRMLAAGLVIVVGIGLVATPFVLRLLRDRDAERRARIRGEERAELAAQVHDSVLQTLTLIQRSSSDPAAVARLARAQERDLRRWLYVPSGPASHSLRAALEAAAADVEDDHGVVVEVVCVGDLPVDERVGSLVLACREALVNAAKHSGTTVSMYAEVEPGQVTVFVRDRGQGFDPGAVATDRMGIRESIVGRMERNGGSALVRSLPGEGTQVELRLPRGEEVRP